jgi:ribosome-associated protein
MLSEELLGVVTTALDDLKGQEVKTLDVRGLTSITDYMVIVSGTSERHVKSLADLVVERVKEAGAPTGGVEGGGGSGWVLVDLFDVVVHVMQPSVRDFYALERLWEPGGHEQAARESKED